MIYSVIVDISNNQVDKIFDYKSDKQFLLGQRVDVPFNNRVSEGFIVEIKQTTDCPTEKLKEIICAKEDFSAISPKMLELGIFMQKKYHLRFIDVLRLFIPAEMRGNRIKQLTKRQATINADIDFETAQNSIKKTATKQIELLQFLHQQKTALCETINQQFSYSALKALEQKGFVKIEDVVVRRTPQFLSKIPAIEHQLTQTQQNVVGEILKNPTSSFLIHGVTGSGKTEVYMHIIDSLVAAGKTCIMLVPEISLTPNMMRLFHGRFGDTVALLHSGLSAGERFDEWLRLKKGQAKIAIGARSAIFAPLENLGAIIIDEEHDGSYISDFNPRYDTKEIAKFRTNQSNCLLILGSATPSLETYHLAQQRQIKILTLPQRINKQPLPDVEIVDMAKQRKEGNKGIFSTVLVEKLTKTLESGNQAMLFLNRRGFSSFLMCKNCGYVAKCNDCDISLTVHKEDGLLKCHFCSKRYRILTECPECHEKSFRQGKIGTQQVVEEVNRLFPNTKVLRMDSDTTQNKLGHDKILTAFANKEAQILVGTQMIAKGHDFPAVTFVGILDGDQSLYFNNFLAAERTFQLLTQVAGRSGRDSEVGSVVLQTFTPNHYCLQLAAKQDYVSFFKREINIREASKFPPFALIVRILYQGQEEKSCIEQLTADFDKITEIKHKNPDQFIYLDKMRCPLKRAERKFRFQILIKLEVQQNQDIIDKIYEICDQQQKRDVQVFVELNPQSLT